MADRINYVVDADIKEFFDNIDHNWMITFLEHDIADKNFIRYIKRFLIGGVMEDGKKLETDRGTVQGGLISPVLANVYLHYVLDTWFEYVKKHEFRAGCIWCGMPTILCACFSTRMKRKSFIR